MTPQEIAEAILSKPMTYERLQKIARIVKTAAQLDAVLALLPDDMRATVNAAVRSKVM